MRGIVQVVDVSDIEHPHIVAHYSVPGARARTTSGPRTTSSIWATTAEAEESLDVSGELRGDLCIATRARDGAWLWTGVKGTRGVSQQPSVSARGAQRRTTRADLTLTTILTPGSRIVKLGKPDIQGVPPLRRVFHD